MIIVRLRRAAGLAMLLGVLGQIVLFALAFTGHVSNNIPVPEPSFLTTLSFVFFLIWMASLVGSGAALIGDYYYSPLLDILGLLAWVGLLLCVFGTVPLVLGRVHSFNNLLAAYAFNIVPAVQFMTLVVLNPHTEPERLRPIPQ